MEGGQKKQVPLRLSRSLYDALAAWAAEDFRSVNGQIEYLLNECVKRRGRLRSSAGQKPEQPDPEA